MAARRRSSAAREARLVPQGRVPPLVLLDSTERQAVCFTISFLVKGHASAPRQKTGYHGNRAYRQGACRYTARTGQAPAPGRPLILREHDAEQQAVRPVKSEQSIDRAVGVNQTVGGGKRLCRRAMVVRLISAVDTSPTWVSARRASCSARSAFPSVAIGASSESMPCFWRQSISALAFITAQHGEHADAQGSGNLLPVSRIAVPLLKQGRGTS